MKYAVLILFAALLFTSCMNECKKPSKEEMEMEKEKVLEVVKTYNRLSEEKKYSEFQDILSDELVFFGTDSAEAIRTISDFLIQIEKQGQMFDKFKYGKLDPNSMSIQMDDYATLASVIFGISLTVSVDSVEKTMYLRVQRTLKKDHKRNRWVIVSGLVGITNTGQIDEMNELMRVAKAKEE